MNHIPHDLLVALRRVHRAQGSAHDHELMAYGLARLHTALHTTTYRWESPEGPACLKLYHGINHRNLALTELAALRHLAAHGVSTIRQPWWHDPHPNLPALAAPLPPGEPLTDLADSRPTLGGLADILARLHRLPLGPFDHQPRAGSAPHLIDRVVEFVGIVGRAADDPATLATRELLMRWYGSGDHVVLAQPAPRVISRGQDSLAHWIWQSEYRTLCVQAWEHAGYSDAAYDAAALVEHPTATVVDEPIWQALLPRLGVFDGVSRRRFAAARRTIAVHRLVMRWARRHECPEAFDGQLRHTHALLAITPSPPTASAHVGPDVITPGSPAPQRESR